MTATQRWARRGSDGQRLLRRHPVSLRTATATATVTAAVLALGAGLVLAGCSASEPTPAPTPAPTASADRPAEPKATAGGSTSASVAPTATIEVVVLVDPTATNASVGVLVNALAALPGAAAVRRFTSFDALAEMRCLYPAQAARLDGLDASLLPPSVRVTVPAGTVVDEASLRLLSGVGDVIIGTPTPSGVVVTTPSCLPRGTPIR